MQTSIRLFLYIYHYLTHSAFVVLITLLLARVRFLYFLFSSITSITKYINYLITNKLNIKKQ